MRKPLIAGNWKMNLLSSKVPEYFKKLEDVTASVDKSKVEMLLAVPALFAASARELAGRTGVHVATQTIHEKADGAFTGELSIPMIKDLGLNWTLIGHSERRQYYNETDASVALKTKACLESGIHAIVCVGETRAEREGGQMESVLSRQMKSILDVCSADSVLTIAYEPVWAIGTGLTASDAQAEEAHAFIRKTIKDRFADLAEKTRILYGGSVKSSNIQGLLGQKNVDGALIGGASLDPAEFGKTVSLAAAVSH
ncbi:MAG: triose-phosphate isomerase [Proteobacteria bacterium]|nr:MAG: triose-phosphate isomerase [Pseudomonadota bacterium]